MTKIDIEAMEKKIEDILRHTDLKEWQIEDITKELLDLFLVSECILLPKGHKMYKCTNCQKVNSKKDNGEINVGNCRNCNHPLWNDAN